MKKNNIKQFNPKVTELQPLFCEDLTKGLILDFLQEKDFYSDYPFLLNKSELDRFHEWVTLYLEGIEFVYNTFDGWVIKYCILRQKRLNGGF